MPKLSITNKQIAEAINLACPPGRKVMDFVKTLTIRGPEDKYLDWQKVCGILSKAKNISHPNRHWRQRVHRIFMNNIFEIEKMLLTIVLSSSTGEFEEVDLADAIRLCIARCHEIIDRQCRLRQI